MANNPFPFSAGSQIQPYTSSLEAVAAPDSTAIFTGPLTPPGQTFSVSLQCAGSPDTGVFVAEINGAAVGNFRGGNTYGPLQIVAGNQLIVTATGLIPGLTYYLTLTGIAYTSVITLPSYPAAYADSVTTATEQVYLGETPSTESTSIPVTIQPLWRSIWVIVTGFVGTPSNVQVTFTGGTTGILYPSYLDSQWTKTSGGVILYYYRIPLVYGMDSMGTLLVTFSGATGANVFVGADLENVATVTTSNYSPTYSATNIVQASLSPSVQSVTVLPSLSGSGSAYYLKSCDFLYDGSLINTLVIVNVQATQLGGSSPSVISQGYVEDGGASNNSSFFTQNLDNFRTSGPVIVSSPFTLTTGQAVASYLRYSIGP